MPSFSEQVYAVVRRIPRGRVSTYGAVALMAGHPGAARAVGSCLHRNPYFGDVPCHRVVNSGGQLAAAFVFGGASVQRRMLREEGVLVSDQNTISLKEFFWNEKGE